MTIIIEISTLVNINACLTVTRKPTSTCTAKTALWISADGMGGTRILIFTFINVNALNSVAFIASFTFAFKPTNSIGAFSVTIAVITFTISTFIYVLTLSILFEESIVANTFKWSWFVCAGTIFADICFSFTFVNVITSYITFAIEASLTGALKTTKCIFADSIDITIVLFGFALIDIDTDTVFTEEAWLTWTAKFPRSIDTVWNSFITIVCTNGTLVDIYTAFSITVISGNTFTFIFTNSIAAGSVSVTMMRTVATFIDIKTRMSISFETVESSEPRSTSTWKRSL
jgi:hypothetical protein